MINNVEIFYIYGIIFGLNGRIKIVFFLFLHFADQILKWPSAVIKPGPGNVEMHPLW
jgi:hypothetical protein